MKAVKNNFKILVVDDEIELLDTVAEQIETIFGYTVLKAYNVDQAMELAPMADGVLADVNMPNKDKLNTFLRTIGKPVIRFSAENQTRICNFELTKPFNAKNLEAVLTKLVKMNEMYKAA